jgi:TonB-dependent receptor
MFAQVRGMNSEFTLNLINGVDVAQGMPYSREVQLSLLPPSGLQTIVVAKTAQADMQSDFIGGAVDFRTPTAFDFADDQTFSVTIGGRGETRAMDYGQNGLGGLASAAASKKFGADNQFGIYVGGYYDIRQFANSEFGALMEISGDNAWAFAVSDATGHNPVGYKSGQNLQSTGFNIGISSGYTARYGATASLEWKLDDTAALHARLTYAYAHTEQNSTLSQILGSDIGTGSSGIEIGTTGLYLPKIASVSTRLWYETNPEMADLGTAQIGGEKRFSNKLILSANVFYSWGNNDRPNHIEISARPVTDFAYGGTALLSYGTNNFPIPALSQAMLDRLGDVGVNAARRAGQLTLQHSGQDKLGATLDAVYAVANGILDSVKIGFKTETSWRATDNTDYTNAKYTDGTLFSALGLYSASWSQVYPGKYTWPVPKIDQAALFELFYSKRTTNSSDSCATPALMGICNTQTGREAVTSGYAMATLRFGDMDVIPGLRYEHTRIHNVFWQDTLDSTGAWISGAFTSNNTSYDEVLPSLLLNWRPSENSVYRASIWTGYTRPAFVQLANATTVSKNDAYSSITVGNPDLKPVEALNFDLSGQWSSAMGGYAQVTAFAKALSNYLYNAGSEQVNAGTISHVTKPENGGSGHVYGLEFELRQSFDTLPGWLSGFAIGANYTQNWTKVDLGANTALHNERIQNAPDTMINAQLLYEKYGIQFDMLWHYSGAYVARYDVLSQGASWDDEWIRPMQRVDLHIGYDFSSGSRIDGSVSNLCDNITYWSHVGGQSLAISDIVDTGRTALLTLKYSY